MQHRLRRRRRSLSGFKPACKRSASNVSETRHADRRYCASALPNRSRLTENNTRSSYSSAPCAESVDTQDAQSRRALTKPRPTMRHHCGFPNRICCSPTCQGAVRGKVLAVSKGHAYIVHLRERVASRNEHVNEWSFSSQRRAQPARSSARSKNCASGPSFKGGALRPLGQFRRGCATSVGPSTCKACTVCHHRGPRRWRGARAGDFGWRMMWRGLTDRDNAGRRAPKLWPPRQAHVAARSNPRLWPAAPTTYAEATTPQRLRRCRWPCGYGHPMLGPPQNAGHNDLVDLPDPLSKRDAARREGVPPTPPLFLSLSEAVRGHGLRAACRIGLHIDRPCSDPCLREHLGRRGRIPIAQGVKAARRLQVDATERGFVHPGASVGIVPAGRLNKQIVGAPARRLPGAVYTHTADFARTRLTWRAHG